MSTSPAVLTSSVTAAAQAAHLEVLLAEPAVSASGIPTTRFALAMPKGLETAGHQPVERQTVPLELSERFNVADPKLAALLATFMTESAQRLRNPRPNLILTLGGIPLSYSNFEWPFHESTAGADTSLVHGQVQLEDGSDQVLFAKISAAMTLTFREVVLAPEQPVAESFILNAVRKTFDQGQLELVKSGNRQPVPVTTRFYSAKQQKFIFNDTTEEKRKNFLALKVFWFSGVLGGGHPVWIADPRDAQYLNTSVDDLKQCAASLSAEGMIAPAGGASTSAAGQGFAAPTEKLMARSEELRADLKRALTFIKPSFNESMRGGQTNM